MDPIRYSAKETADLALRHQRAADLHGFFCGSADAFGELGELAAANGGAQFTQRGSEESGGGGGLEGEDCDAGFRVCGGGGGDRSGDRGERLRGHSAVIGWCCLVSPHPDPLPRRGEGESIDRS